MKRFLLALFFCLLSSGAWAQCTGNFPPGTACGNNGVASAPPKPVAVPFSGSNNTFTGLNTFAPTVAGTAVTITPSTSLNTGLNKGLSINQTAHGVPVQDTCGSGTGVGWNFNQICIVDEGVDTTGFPPGSGLSSFTVATLANAPKSSTSSIYGSYKVFAPPAAGTDLNFTASTFIGLTTANLGGSGLTEPTAKGSIFGGGFSAIAGADSPNAATFLRNVSAQENNCGIYTGASSRRFSCFSVAPAPDHAVDGSAYDTLISISSQSTHGVTSGILFSDYNGHQPLSTTGTLIKTQGSGTVAAGLDFSSYTFTGNVIATSNAFLTNNGDWIAPSGSTFGWNGLGGWRSSAAGVIKLDNSVTGGFTLDGSTTDTFKCRNFANNADCTFFVGTIVSSSDAIIAPGSAFAWNGIGGWRSNSAGIIKLDNNTTGGFILDGTTNNTFKCRNFANSADCTFTAGAGTFSGATTLSALGSDATHTDNTVCADTGTGLLYKGSGAAGICLGTSSLRFKQDVRPLNEGLQAVMGLKPIAYRYLPGYGTTDKDLYGFSAENVEHVIPDLVGRDKQGLPNSVDWAGMVPVLAKAIQELKADNDNLRQQIERLAR